MKNWQIDLIFMMKDFEKERVSEIIEKMYLNTDPFKISTTYRKVHNISDQSFTYGEILPRKFLDILDLVDFGPDSIFYDLGSGSGKAVLVTSLYKNPKKAIGIEYIPDLVELSRKILEKLENYLGYKLNVEFVNNDIKNCDFSDGNVIFFHATCAKEDLMKDFLEKTLKLKKGSKIIIVTKRLESSHLRLLYTNLHQFSWGEGTVRIYERI